MPIRFGVESEAAQLLSSHTRTSAPGKLVISGEYAVLLDAPAIAMAVNRRAFCELGTSDSEGWVIRSQPAFWNSRLTLETIKAGNHELGVVDKLRLLNEFTMLPEHAQMSIDSRSLYTHGKKMGLGSSAASFVSMYFAICQLTGSSPSVEECLKVYASLPDSGSGVDIATSFKGGVIQFQSGVAQSVNLPNDIRIEAFYVGVSTRTSDKLLTFQDWISSQPSSTAERLCEASTCVTRSTTNASNFLDAVRFFIEVQEIVDNSSGLGIWGPQHRALRSEANREGVLYKPSGAGGGDIGIAISTDQEALKRMAQSARNMGFLPLDLAVEQDGVRVEANA